MLGPAVLCAIVFVVAEIPRLAWMDQLLAACARHCAGSYFRCPVLPERPVLCAVAPLGCCTAAAVIDPPTVIAAP
jgi:hypothetical protein